MDTTRKQKQSIPPLFKAIIENDAQRSSLKAQDVIPFAEMRRLTVEKRDFRHAAEKHLSHNTNKGFTA